ncbi:hypothetical protein CMUS01_11876 [Colletotrichum musicola]|uniref:Beta-galactosidase trimerisation domain-containing protein n=1 Tax=Colletotrichum musicola TaxID=2175873 RepID=A0A8H6JT46_9PEZI|nr:hypothetical protein CMUS01_11876 [Colletotrichum musicola]
MQAWESGIQAQYPTHLPFHSKNTLVSQRQSGDPIQDAMSAARARGLWLLARIDFSKISAEVVAEHPEWCYVSPTGTRQGHTGDLFSVCPSGGYYLERIFDILEEVTKRYPVDGFFINWTTMNEEDYYQRYHGVFHCVSCQQRWLEVSGGLLLPAGPTDKTYAMWLKFSRVIIDELTARIRAFISDSLPDACLILGKTANIMFHEANNASYRPKVPVLVNSTCFMDMPYRMATEEPAYFAQCLIQCISRGGYPSTYMMDTPGKIPYVCLDVAVNITRFHKRWSSVCDGMRPCSKTGLVRPDRAHMAGDQFSEALSEFRGLYAAMQELHVAFDVLAQEHLLAMGNTGELKRYQVVVLPNLGKLGAVEATSLDNWLHEGGHIITTGSSAIEDNGASQLRSLPFDREFERNSDRERLFSTYFAPPQASLDAHVFNGPIVPLNGVYHALQWKASSKGGYKMLSNAPFAPPEKAYGNVQTNERGYGAGDHGSGREVSIPFSVGRGYRELGLGVFRDFYEGILRKEGAAKESVRFEIAEQVEMTLNANGSSTSQVPEGRTLAPTCQYRVGR